MSALHEYREARERLSRWLLSLAEFPTASDVKTGAADEALTVSEALRGLANKVRDDRFKVAVVGEYSSGKSSLLNVLLRLHSADNRKADGLLPTAVTPTTAVITTLVYDEARQIEITLDDGRTLPVSAEQLNGFLTEPTLRRKKFWWSSHAEENEQLAAHIRKVRVGCISPLLGEGVELVDTPGIGSINEDHARITRQFTAEIDAALFLVSVDPPMGQREMAFLQHIKSITDRCLFVQTKRDFGERTEHGELVWQKREREHRRRIEEVLERNDYPFFCVSAYQAARGLRREDGQEFADSGFGALEAELQRFLVAERGTLRFEGWVKHSREAINLLETALRVKREQLAARLADTALQVASEEDYAQWQKIAKSLAQQLTDNAIKAEEKLSLKKPLFEAEVMREAQRELTLTTAKQLAEDSDRRFQLERAVVKAVQYQRNDLLIPVIDAHKITAQDALDEALGGEVPKALQQFRRTGFDLTASHLDIHLGDLIETNTYIKETKRGGLGIVDYFAGPIRNEVTDYNLDKKRFIARVEKATEGTYREAKSELRDNSEKMQQAGKVEISRVSQAAKAATKQQAEIQQQDIAECKKQVEDNQQHSLLLKELANQLNHLSAFMQEAVQGL